VPSSPLRIKVKIKNKPPQPSKDKNKVDKWIQEREQKTLERSVSEITLSLQTLKYAFISTLILQHKLGGLLSFCITKKKKKTRFESTKSTLMKPDDWQSSEPRRPNK
jgi:hypothetical protein